jgi:serine/threonine protein kinase
MMTSDADTMRATWAQSFGDGETPQPPTTPDLARARDASEQRYARLEEVGRGGMGEVHLCHDSTTGYDVAIKTLLSGRPLLVEAFLREARLQAQLEHPGVVPIYDILDGDGAPSFSTKRVHGKTLTKLLERGATRERALGIVADVAQTLAYVHGRGVVHRDVKPDNVMVGAFGEVHLLDWGVATIPRLGAVEGVAGTPGYMAPEQARGEPDLDARADVYAWEPCCSRCSQVRRFMRVPTPWRSSGGRWKSTMSRSPRVLPNVTFRRSSTGSAARRSRSTGAIASATPGRCIAFSSASSTVSATSRCAVSLRTLACSKPSERSRPMTKTALFARSARRSASTRTTAGPRRS